MAKNKQSMKLYTWVVADGEMAVMARNIKEARALATEEHPDHDSCAFAMNPGFIDRGPIAVWHS